MPTAWALPVLRRPAPAAVTRAADRARRVKRRVNTEILLKVCGSDGHGLDRCVLVLGPRGEPAGRDEQEGGVPAPDGTRAATGTPAALQAQRVNGRDRPEHGAARGEAVQQWTWRGRRAR
ncbi:hypothetical protein GCM10018781_67720 [Kitasatospora indigofera]|uniref:Uncharacterized protein n=1 Tax=Kitasatospora indigofera TaxID=67307 RepID=A0A919GEI3_9ACTN|nr:hypothetical protein GCM10018781_67720 [Kitasatospora indigofera]